MNKMLTNSLVLALTLVAAPLLAVPADKCCGNKPRPAGRPATTRTAPAADATDKCGCNANKPKGTVDTKSCGSCNSCNSCKPCCGK